MPNQNNIVRDESYMKKIIYTIIYVFFAISALATILGAVFLIAPPLADKKLNLTVLLYAYVVAGGSLCIVMGMSLIDKCCLPENVIIPIQYDEEDPALEITNIYRHNINNADEIPRSPTEKKSLQQGRKEIHVGSLQQNKKPSMQDRYENAIEKLDEIIEKLKPLQNNVALKYEKK